MSRPTITYAAGCKFCRWVARTILKRFDVDIIPSRDKDADKFFDKWTMEERTGHWHYISQGGEFYTPYTYHKVVNALAAMKINGNVIPKWTPWWMIWKLKKLDTWVKVHRPFLSKLVPDGPAYKRIGNKWWWMEERVTSPNGELMVIVEPLNGFPKEGLDVK